jgi:hypothetical protein
MIMGLVMGEHYKNSEKVNNFDINYDVNINKNIHTILPTENIVYCDEMNVVFTSNDNSLMNSVIVSDNCQPAIPHTIELINNVYQYVADVVNVGSLIENGIINITQTGLNKVKVPFCFGFNTDKSCSNPSYPIVLFSDDIVDITCDNCFIGFSGDVFIDMSFAAFHLKRVAVGFEDMYLKGGLGVYVKASKDMAYVYNKIFEVLSKFKLVSFGIGPLKFDVYVDMPINIYFSADLSAVATLRTGSNLNINIGDLYLQYENSKFQVVKPNPIVIQDQYLDVKANVNGKLYFKIIPSISIYANSIFKFNVIFQPYVNLKLDASTTTRNVCVTGDYDLYAYVNGKVLSETIPDTKIYDSGVKQYLKKCVSY